MYKLTQDQEKALKLIREWKVSDKKLFMLKGAGGTGKTFLSESAMRENRKVPKKKVVGMTVGHLARLQLQKSIPDSRTYAASVGLTMDFSDDPDNPLGISFIKRNNFKPKDLDKAQFIVLDECSMLGDNDLNNIKDVVPNNCKVLLMGDKAQLPKVGAINDEDSELFDIDGYELTEPVRQKEGDSILELSRNIRDYIFNNKDINNVYGLEKTSVSNGKGYVFGTKSQCMKSYSNSLKNNEDSLCVTFRNKSKDNINHEVRKLLFKGDDMFNEGERIIFKAQYNPRGFWNQTSYGMMYLPKGGNQYYNGERHTIQSVSEKVLTKSFLLNLFKANEYTSNRKEYAELKRLYNEVLCMGILTHRLELEGCDIPIYVLNDCDKQKYHEVKESLRKIAYVNGNISILNQFTSKFANIDYGNAVTIYSAQGQSIDKVYVDMSDVMLCNKLSNKRKLQSLYVAFTRARNNLAIF